MPKLSKATAPHTDENPALVSHHGSLGEYTVVFESYRVDSDGFITFPMINKVAAGGITPVELQERIRTMLASGYIRNPQVRVEVDADGSFSVVLRTSSGNPEIDRRVLEALKRWRWKPALRDGEPVKSTQLFKFEFEVE